MKSFIVLILSFSISLQAQSESIIIFWYGMGLGHRVPAERISNYIQESHTDSSHFEVKLIDIKEFALFDELSEESGKNKYLNWATHDADSYTDYFQWHLERNPSDLKSSFDLNRLAQFLIDEKPQVIISTFWGAAHAIYLLKREFPELQIPTALLYTDYEVRNFVSMSPLVDTIFMPSQNLVNKIPQKYPHIHFSTQSFQSSGIPVNSEQLKKLKNMTKKDLRHSVGLSEATKVISLARGGEAQIPVVKIARRILEDFQDKNIQMVILAGKSTNDDAAIRKLQDEFGAHKIIKIGSIPNQEYLKHIVTSDIMITKPGGVTITEIALAGVPMIFMNGLGGQERDNYNEFVTNGLALDGGDLKGILQSIKTILRKPKKATQMIHAQHDYFSAYHPELISDWVHQQTDTTQWEDFQQSVTSPESTLALQNFFDLSPIAFKNWFYYLNDLSRCDLNEDKELKTMAATTSICYLKKGIQALDEKLIELTTSLDNTELTEVHLIQTKWRILKNHILQQSLHGHLNKAYKKPNHHKIQTMINEIVEFSNSPGFTEMDRQWEFTKDILNKDLANYYYFENFTKKSLYHTELALEQENSNKINESMVQLKGNILASRGRYKAAIHHFETYLAINPQFHGVRLSLIKILHEQGFSIKADHHIQEFKKHHHKMTESQYFRLASLYLKRFDTESALDFLLKGLQNRPNSLFLHTLIQRLTDSNPDLAEALDTNTLHTRYEELRQKHIENLNHLPL